MCQASTICLHVQICKKNTKKVQQYYRSLFEKLVCFGRRFMSPRFIESAFHVSYGTCKNRFRDWSKTKRAQCLGKRPEKGDVYICWDLSPPPPPPTHTYTYTEISLDAACVQNTPGYTYIHTQVSSFKYFPFLRNCQ